MQSFVIQGQSDARQSMQRPARPESTGSATGPQARQPFKASNWIYVTGAPRSGTTFVGKILSAPLTVDYIHEPFNPDCSMPGIHQRYLYVRPGSAAAIQLRQVVEPLFRYDTRLKTGYFRNDRLWRKLVKFVVGSRGPFYLRLAKLNVFRRAAIIKDPVGCLLTEFLAAEFPVRPVVLVRHPAAFVASVRKLKWPNELPDLTSQPALVADYLAGDPLLSNPENEDPVVATALLWRALNRVILDQAARHPEWILVTLEELSRDPLHWFRRTYAMLDLPWSPRIERLVQRSTAAGNRTEAGPNRVQDFRRDSAAIFQHSLRKLTREERAKVFELTEDVARQLYPRESFALDLP